MILHSFVCTIHIIYGHRIWPTNHHRMNNLIITIVNGWNLFETVIDGYSLKSLHFDLLMGVSRSCSNIFSSCYSHIHEVHIQSDGRVSARVNFRLTSQCIIDYTHYPEDSNHCCLSLSIADLITSFNGVASADKLLSQQPIGITKSGKSTTNPVVEHSPWMLQVGDDVVDELIFVCIEADCRCAKCWHCNFRSIACVCQCRKA